MPLPCSSAPRTEPYWRASGGSQADDMATDAGNWVTPVSPSPTPSGPSSSLRAGMHSDGMAGVAPIAPAGLGPGWPVAIDTLSASVIRGTSRLTLRWTGSDWLSQGQLAVAVAAPLAPGAACAACAGVVAAR